MSVTGTLVEAKLCILTFESTHFIFNKCPIYTHDGASAKFSTNSHETGEAFAEQFVRRAQGHVLVYAAIQITISDEKC